MDIKLLLIIKGIKDNKFNSSPIHILTQEEAEIVISVPITKLNIKINLEKKFII